MDNPQKSLNFLEEIIENDLAAGTHAGRVLTRFPPEPNGYLHIGHATSICLNFGIAQKYGGSTNLRFDDTNPSTEETEYVDSIINDVRWLGFEPATIVYASDYFDQLYDWAKSLIIKGFAYVDFSDSETIAKEKGTTTRAGVHSAWREKHTPEENLAMFEKMKNGGFADGECVLRAKIDMASPNMIMRDPLLYRIKRAHHHRTHDKWCIYPMYDFAHGQSDSIEKITHSICTMEFIPHRELYDWCIEKLEIFPSKQYEFARRNLSYAITSKRKLMRLVKEGHVNSWDDPRMPTISGFRRRGYTAASIREFCNRIGVGKREMMADMALLDFCLREELNKTANRAMVVLDPLKVTITNLPKNHHEILTVENNPEDTPLPPKGETSADQRGEDEKGTTATSPLRGAGGVHALPFSNEIWIERDDFMENAPKKYFRLAVGAVVRLKHAYIITCDEVIKDENGNITELKCSYIENSKSGNDTSGVNVKGTIHWVNIADAIPAEVRLYDRLFQVENPADADTDEAFLATLNPESLKIVKNAYAEPYLATAKTLDRFQFLRKGYFCVDTDSTPENLVFNMTVGLKDSFKK
jgi:glutaminyl-tRNA synthetase